MTEVIAYEGLHWDVQHCIETYLTNLSSWLDEQGRAVLIVLGHSIRSNPSIIYAQYPNMTVVFRPDTSITLLPLQLDAIHEFMHYTRLLSCTTSWNKMQPLVSNCPTTMISRYIMCGKLGSLSVIWLLLAGS